LDWKWVKETAFGPLNLSHETFWKLQPSEFIELYEGWLWRENRRIDEIKELNEMEMRRMSILASWLTAPHYRKPKKPTDFYNPDKKKPKPKTTPDESKRMVLALTKEMGVR
jgi:hypothetical protein